MNKTKYGVPVYPDAKTEVYESSYGSVVHKVLDTTAEGYEAYLKLLEEAGFTRYTGNVIGKNLFATYISDSYTVNVYYIDNNHLTRIVEEPRGALPILKEQNVYEKKVDTLVTGVKLETILFYEGMSYLIRLCDGSFILIDGGASDPDGIECGKMIDLIRSQTPEGEKPVIAAWMFTHCHGDHIGLFSDFVIKYHDEVEIQSLVYNFPKDEELGAKEAYMLDNSTFRYNAFRKTRETYLADVPVIRPHTGNQLFIRNASFEVLETYEDIYPYSAATHYINASTVVYRMEVDGQKTMWLGDAAEIAGDMMIEQFGDYLKSDIMQIAHHGGPGGTVRLYERINPEYCLYPIPRECYQISYEPTKWACVDSENVKLVMVTGFGTHSIRLPFSVEPGKYIRVPESREDPWVNPAVFE